MEVLSSTFSPELYGAKLHINDTDFTYYEYGDILVIDVETDEKDNFVGLAFTKDGKRIDYVSFGIDYGVIDILLTTGKLVGHNIKSDLKWLIGWGNKIKSEQLHYDTILASYVQNTTKESHGLKELAKEYLGMEWPTYKEIVGSGRNKITLDKQPVETVARYCGMDCLATYRLWQYFEKKLTSQEKKYLQEIELPTARALLDMELRGVEIDTAYLKSLDTQFDVQLDDLEQKVHEQWKDYFNSVPFNINSNRDAANLLCSQGAKLPRTQKGNLKVDKQTLEGWKHLPAVPLLLEYSKIEKLKSTYTEALLEKQKTEGSIVPLTSLVKTLTETQWEYLQDVYHLLIQIYKTSPQGRKKVLSFVKRLQRESIRFSSTQTSPRSSHASSPISRRIKHS